MNYFPQRRKDARVTETEVDFLTGGDGDKRDELNVPFPLFSPIRISFFAPFGLGALAGENPNPERKEKRMSLQVKREDVPEKNVVLKTGEGEGSMIIRQAYGNESSLLVALRPPGYHTRPHMHASEQINHVLEGEIWFFVEDKGYHCKAGDFHRIPANRVHWAWNRSHGITTVVESHSPPLVGGDLRDSAAALFDDREHQQLKGEGENKFVNFDSAKVESKYFSNKKV